jgi:hypothetical protein
MSEVLGTIDSGSRVNKTENHVKLEHSYATGCEITRDNNDAASANSLRCVHDWKGCYLADGPVLS